MMVQANPLGFLLGFVFITAIGTFFFWALRAPASSPLPDARAQRSPGHIGKVLVPLVEGVPSERAVELACRWGNSKKPELALVHVIVVPYILSLDTPMPDQDNAANAALDLANMVAKQNGCRTHMYIVRHRNVADAILEIARKEGVDAIVMSVGFKTRIPGEWRRTGLEILRRASCEVITDSIPMAA